MSTVAHHLEEKWWKSYWHAPAILGILAAIPAVGFLVPWVVGPSGDYTSARLGAWLATLVLMLAFAVVLGEVTTGNWRGILITNRNRLSVSRLQAVLWMAIILSGYLEAILANVALHGQKVAALNVSVPQPLWGALAVSLGSLAAAPIASSVQQTRLKHKPGELAGNEHPSKAQWLDLVDEEVVLPDDTPSVDLGKVQMILATLVLVVVYGIVLAQRFDTGAPGIGALPTVNNVFPILLAVSQGTYILKKGAPQPAPKKKG